MVLLAEQRHLVHGSLPMVAALEKHKPMVGMGEKAEIHLRYVSQMPMEDHRL
jgi:hypothetical protein